MNEVKFWVSLLICAFIVGCSGDSTSESTTNVQNYKIAAAGGSFSNPLGIIYGIQEQENLSANIFKDQSGSQINTYQDSIVRTYQDKIYVLGRDSNSAVLVLDNSNESKDPIANYSLSELDSDGDLDIDGGFNGTNPYDIVFASESAAFVGFYNSNAILKINPLTGKRLNKIDVTFIKTITGASPSDANTPNIVDLELIGTKLYILAQRLNAAYEPLEPVIAIYDTNAEEFIDLDTTSSEINGIILNGKNPSEMFYSEAMSKIFIAHRGSVSYNSDYSAIESSEIGSTGIEAINVSSNTSAGIIISGTAFGGTSGGYGIGKILYDSKNSKYFATYDTFDFTSNIKEINLTNNTVTDTTLLSENASSFGDTTIDDDGRLFQINRSSTSPSIEVYNTNNGTLIQSINTELPMQSICVIK